MANERNEQVSRRGFDVFNSGDMSVVDEITADGAVNHDPATPEEAQGPEGFKQFVQMYRTAFPDLHITVDDQVSDGDKVCTRWTSEGTNDGELMGMPATGKHVTSTGISIDKVPGPRGPVTYRDLHLRQVVAVPSEYPALGAEA